MSDPLARLALSIAALANASERHQRTLHGLLACVRRQRLAHRQVEAARCPEGHYRPVPALTKEPRYEEPTR